MSSSGANLALGNVHWEDVLGGTQTSLHLWTASSLRAGPFGTGHTQLSHRRWAGSRSSLRPRAHGPTAGRSRGGNQLPHQRAGETSRRGPGTRVFAMGLAQ